MADNAWKRWGDEDEVGAFNLLTPETVRAAVGLVRDGAVLSLAQPLSGTTATPSNRCGFSHFMTRDGGDTAGRKRRGQLGLADDAMVTPLHLGTHIDALCHVWRDEQIYNGFPARSVRSSGAEHCGIDKLPPFFGRGILVDLAGHALADGVAVTVAMIDKALGNVGEELRAGDAVLIRTGWLERQRPETIVDFDTEPGLDVEAAEWLAAHGVALVGADNFAIEQIPFAPDEAFPVHQRLICDFGIPLLEGLVLAPLAARGRSSFLFVTAPLPIVGATGSPVAPIAIL